MKQAFLSGEARTGPRVGVRRAYRFDGTRPGSFSIDGRLTGWPRALLPGHHPAAVHRLVPLSAPERGLARLSVRVSLSPSGWNVSVAAPANSAARPVKAARMVSAVSTSPPVPPALQSPDQCAVHRSARGQHRRDRSRVGVRPSKATVVVRHRSWRSAAAGRISGERCRSREPCRHRWRGWPRGKAEYRGREDRRAATLDR